MSIFDDGNRQMRITGGAAKGIPLKAPGGASTRPTSDKVREALFSVLGESISDARVLDLFAGSGALGIEALSRGARYAVFVESSPAAIRTITANLETAGLSETAEIIRADFRAALRKIGKRDDSFDIVFLDPPYQAGLLEDTAGALARHNIVSLHSIIVVEHFKKTRPPGSISDIPLSRTRTYGQTCLSYYLRPDSWP